MTLFNEVSDDDLFRKVLERYYSGLADEKTLVILGKLDVKFLCGAMAGDIIGSFYEFNATKKYDFYLFTPFSKFTDDTVMTVANADWLITGDSLLGVMQDYGNRYPHAGYGGMFRTWLREDEPKPYNSFGNGSAMRVSPVGWAFDTLGKTLEAAKESAEVTHNHPEGIKGAQATAACIFLARTGKSKEEIKDYIEKTFGYNLSRTCDEIRPSYKFNETCQGTVPESIIAFLDSTDFESAIRLAISLGGDADTIGAITGGIAEAYYGDVPKHIKKEVLKRLPLKIIRVLQNFYHKFIER
jgi:ADP-ribosylglycohydrolase